MKANELMIGDWVECTYWTPSKQLKVAEIRRIMDDEIKIGVYSDDLVLIFRQSEVKPIPLTPEILEKNGFKKCAGNEWSIFKYKDDDYTKKALYQVLWSADELYLRIDSYTSRTGEFNRMGVEFVHELQHALRLCGIEKEIVL